MDKDTYIFGVNFNLRNNYPMQSGIDNLTSRSMSKAVACRAGVMVLLAI